MPSAGERKAAADILAKAKARTARVTLCLDGELEDRLEAAREAFDAAPEDEGLASELVSLEAEAEDASTEFVFQVARGRWRKLMADHPPTDQQKTQGAEFDVDEFPFAAMAEFLVEPVMTADELKQLNDDAFDEVKFSKLWGACLKAAVGGQSRPSSEAARLLLSTRGNSKHASNSASAGVSS